MSTLNETIAIEVDDIAFNLKEILKVAQSSGNLGFLQDSINTLLINKAALAEGLSVSDGELQLAADDFRQQHGLQSAKDTMDWLNKSLMSEDSFEDRLKSKILSDKLKIKMVSGQEEQYFAENMVDFQAATISQIVLSDEGLADEVISQIEDEETDFSTMAKLHSTDLMTKPMGGYIGEIGRNQLSPAVQIAVFGASEGDVVGPVKTDAGFHIIKINQLSESIFNDVIKSHITDLLYKKYLNEMIGKQVFKWTLLDEL